MVVIISDFFDDAETLLEALHHLKHKRHDGAAAASDGPRRIDLSVSQICYGRICQPGKSSDRLRLDPALMRARYLENLATHQHAPSAPPQGPWA